MSKMIKLFKSQTELPVENLKIFSIALKAFDETTVRPNGTYAEYSLYCGDSGLAREIADSLESRLMQWKAEWKSKLKQAIKEESARL